MDDVQRVIDRQRRYNDEALASFRALTSSKGSYLWTLVRLTEDPQLREEAERIYQERFNAGELIHPNIAIELARDRLSQST